MVVVITELQQSETKQSSSSWYVMMCSLEVCVYCEICEGRSIKSQSATDTQGKRAQKGAEGTEGVRRETEKSAWRKSSKKQRRVRGERVRRKTEKKCVD